MTKFRLICPECSAVVITANPEAMVWELCPGCRSHSWDLYDVRMAEVHESGREGAHGAVMHPNN